MNPSHITRIEGSIFLYFLNSYLTSIDEITINLEGLKSILKTITFGPKLGKQFIQGYSFKDIAYSKFIPNLDIFRKLLYQSTRQEIFQLVANTPGLTVSKIAQKMTANITNIQEHLDIMIQFRVLRRSKDFSLYYPYFLVEEDAIKAYLIRNNYKILQFLKQEDGAFITTMEHKLKMHNHTLKKRLKLLDKYSLIKSDFIENRVFYFLK